MLFGFCCLQKDLKEYGRNVFIGTIQGGVDSNCQNFPKCQIEQTSVQDVLQEFMEDVK